jgi:hypothetical protein
MKKPDTALENPCRREAFAAMIARFSCFSVRMLLGYRHRIISVVRILSNTVCCRGRQRKKAAPLRHRISQGCYKYFE